MRLGRWEGVRLDCVQMGWCEDGRGYGWMVWRWDGVEMGWCADGMVCRWDGV